MGTAEKSGLQGVKSSNTERSLLGTEAIKFAIEKCWLSEQKEENASWLGSGFAWLWPGPSKEQTSSAAAG